MGDEKVSWDGSRSGRLKPASVSNRGREVVASEETQPTELEKQVTINKQLLPFANWGRENAQRPGRGRGEESCKATQLIKLYRVALTRTLSRHVAKASRGRAAKGREAKGRTAAGRREVRCKYCRAGGFVGLTELQAHSAYTCDGHQTARCSHTVRAHASHCTPHVCHERHAERGLYTVQS